MSMAIDEVLDLIDGALRRLESEGYASHMSFMRQLKLARQELERLSLRQSETVTAPPRQPPRR